MGRAREWATPCKPENEAMFWSCCPYTPYISLVPRLSPAWQWQTVKEGKSLVPLRMWCAARWHHSYNELICYVTTRVCRLLWQRWIDREKIIQMAMTVKEVTWLYRQLGILVQFNISYKMQLTYSFLIPGDKTSSPRTGECHLLHSLVFLFASMGQDFSLSNTQSNWMDGLHVSDV